jgi:integrase/recombinase XerD
MADQRLAVYVGGAVNLNVQTGAPPCPPHSNPISPLRQRMLEDMRMRKLGEKTQADICVPCVTSTSFWALARRMPRRRTCVATSCTGRPRGVGDLDQRALTGLRFFFDITLDRVAVMAKVAHVHEPRKLPVILSVEEVTRLLERRRNLKYRAALSVAYGAGLRASEVVSLKVGDIDSERMSCAWSKARARKDRYALLPPTCCSSVLRAWWREGHARGQAAAERLAVPGRDPLDPMSTRQLNRVVHDAAADLARITSASRCTR